MSNGKDKILMCPPDYFTVDYVINPWMAGNEGGMSLDLAVRSRRSATLRNVARLVGLLWLAAGGLAALAIYTGIASV